MLLVHRWNSTSRQAAHPFRCRKANGVQSQDMPAHSCLWKLVHLPESSMETIHISFNHDVETPNCADDTFIYLVASSKNWQWEDRTVLFFFTAIMFRLLSWQHFTKFCKCILKVIDLLIINNKSIVYFIETYTRLKLNLNTSRYLANFLLHFHDYSRFLLHVLFRY